MFWVKRPPEELKNYLSKDPPATLKLDELNAKDLAIVGHRRSGKSTILAKSILHKSDGENALILCTFAPERNFWSKIIQENKITKTVVHTPDSLARYLLNLWAKKEDKRLEWVLDRDVRGVGSTRQAWHDERGYALWLLKNHKMTAGIAHWLLQNEIENFIDNKMLPHLDLLCLDEPEEWEPEAENWIKLLPRRKTIVSTKSSGYLWTSFGVIKFLSGAYTGANKHTNYRHIKIINSLPESFRPSTCIVSQSPSVKLKDFCKHNNIELRRADQLKGRKFNSLCIDKLPTSKKTRDNWGNKHRCYDFLDLIASRGNTTGIITEEDETSMLPKRGNLERFLVWELENLEQEHQDSIEITESLKDKGAGIKI